MYNMLFGVNPLTPLLAKILDLNLSETIVGTYNIYRFRDIHLNKNGSEIIVYTRGGGGNRECYCWGFDDDKTVEKDGHEEGCVVPIHEKLKEHPNYLRDEDDDFDNTYAYWHFSVPEQFKDLCKKLATREKPKTVSEKFSDIINEIENMPREQFEKDPRFKDIIATIKKITEKTVKP